MARRSTCPSCGAFLVGGLCQTCALAAASRFVRREVVVLVVLSVVMVFGFLFTRAAARANHALRLHDGRTWFARGQRELAAGRPAPAVDAFRRALAIDRDSREYRLALAYALVAGHRDETARQTLVGVRRLAPEDPEVNLQLARLERRQNDVGGAIRYYDSALHGSWGEDGQSRRREVRVELVRYLLAHDDRARALSELLSLSGNLPDEAGPHVEAGALFLEAGDAGRALDHFRRALRRDAASRTALAGAGDAAFELADYAAARRFLRAAALAPSEPQFSRLHERLQIADLVLERDPLRPRLPPGQRWERLTSMVRHASQRLEVCLTRATLDPPTRDALASLREELVQWRAEQRRRPARSLEPLEAGVSLVDRIEEGTATCAPADPLDRALQLIARRHEIDRQ